MMESEELSHLHKSDREKYINSDLLKQFPVIGPNQIDNEGNLIEAYSSMYQHYWNN